MDTVASFGIVSASPSGRQRISKMSSMDRDNLIQAVKDARKSKKNYPKLLEILEPTLVRIARRIASQIVDDAVQAAEMKIWRKLDRVDMKQPSTVKPYLMKVAVSAMRDEVQRYLRRTRHQVRISEDYELEAPSKSTTDVEFKGVLLVYLKHIKMTGSFKGCHKSVAAELGIPVSRVTDMFHKEASSLINREGLRSEYDRDELLDELFD